jgi:spore coat protein U-like protein
MKKLLVLAVLALVLGAVPVFAAGDNFQVEVNVVPSCVFTLTNDINFGNLDVTSFGTKTGLGSVTILCTSGQLYQVALDNGQQPDGSGGRQMSDGGIDVLPYELYQEAWPTTKIWKSGTDAMAYNATGNRDTSTVSCPGWSPCCPRPRSGPISTWSRPRIAGKRRHYAWLTRTTIHM